MKVEQITVWLSIIEDKPSKLYVLYAAKAIYIPRNFSCRYEIVTKSSENLLLLGHLHNHHKVL